MSPRLSRWCLLLTLTAGCAPFLDDAPGEDGTSAGWSGDEWVHDPARLTLEEGEWVIYGSGNGGQALTRSVVDLETGEIRAAEGLDADTLAGDWWREVQEWNPTGEFDAPSVSADGRLLTFTVFDEEDGEIRDVTGLAVRTQDGFAPAGVLLSSEGEAEHTPRAMDASLVSADGGSFVVFGSHAGGIFLAELDPESGLLIDDGDRPETDVAPERFTLLAQDLDAGIEAPYLHERDGLYYLFVNKGQCCRGADSTYEVVVGRATDLAGPYLDRDGEDLRDGGGTPFLASEGRFIGPGHVGVQDTGSGEVVGVHFYDGADDGVSKFAAYTLTWVDGWPEVGALQATHGGGPS